MKFYQLEITQKIERAKTIEIEVSDDVNIDNILSDIESSDIFEDVDYIAKKYKADIKYNAGTFNNIETEAYIKCNFSYNRLTNE